jgi:flagellar L-ring protein precursor FlgH
MMRLRRACIATACVPSACILLSCVNHVDPYQPKRRPYEEPPVAREPDAAAPAAPGSLWSDASWVNDLALDLRARRPGELVTVRIVETALAERGAGTDLTRQSEVKASLDALLGVMQAIQKHNPDFDPGAAVGASTANDFKGQGRTSRADKLEATVPARIVRRLASGDLYIEGHRVVLVNDEEHHLYVSGVVRPSDIDASNVVLSSRIADAHIEFTGRGVLSESNRKGWLARLLDWIWPF